MQGLRGRSAFASVNSPLITSGACLASHAHWGRKQEISTDSLRQLSGDMCLCLGGVGGGGESAKKIHKQNENFSFVFLADPPPPISEPVETVSISNSWLCDLPG